MVTFAQAQPGIFAGESGGDYDALYGYAQDNPNSPFFGTSVSNMTVGEVIDFTMPKGAYGTAQKNDLGYVATPVGAYQIVGATLRDAVKALGIDPNQKFDKATQDRLGEYIFNTQGTGAWEGYQGPGSEGVTRMSARDHIKGFDNMLNTPMEDFEMPFRYDVARFMGNMGDTLISMGTGRGAPQLMHGDMLYRQAEQRQMRNHTAQYLKANGMDDLANMVATGQMTGAEALQMARGGGGSWASAGDGMLFNTATGETMNIRGDEPAITADSPEVTTGLKLVDDYRQEIAPYSEATGAAHRLQAAYQQAQNTDDPAQTAAADLAMIYAYGKLLDPGSVVRESEAAMIQGAQGLYAQLSLLEEKVKSGQFLTPQLRDEMMRLTQEMMRPIIEKGSTIQSRYTTAYEQLGIPDYLLPELTPFEFAPTGGGGAGAPQPSANPADPLGIR